MTVLKIGVPYIGKVNDKNVPNTFTTRNPIQNF